ncbi:hypothetical protein STEG23_028694 [Scotinomys teguina]
METEYGQRTKQVPDIVKSFVLPCPKDGAGFRLLPSRKVLIPSLKDFCKDQCKDKDRLTFDKYLVINPTTLLLDDDSEEPISDCLEMLNIIQVWVEAFPSCTEMAQVVVRKLIMEIISRFGLPISLGSNNDSDFMAKLSQLLPKGKSIGLKYNIGALTPQALLGVSAQEPATSSSALCSQLPTSPSAWLLDPHIQHRLLQLDGCPFSSSSSIFCFLFCLCFQSFGSGSDLHSSSYVLSHCSGI